MARTLLVLLLIAGAAFLVYRQTTVSDSEEVQLVRDLKDRFAVVVNRFTSAAGRSGLTGIDTTDDIDSVVNETLKIRGELAALRKRLTEAAAVTKADELSERIEYFCKKNSIIGP